MARKPTSIKIDKRRARSGRHRQISFLLWIRDCAHKVSQRKGGLVLVPISLLTINGQAANLTVDTLSDLLDGDTSSVSTLQNNPGPDGTISLREAVIASNNTVGSDAIEFSIDTTGTLILTQGELTISSDLILAGPGKDLLSISGDADNSGTPTAADSRILNVISGDVTISNLTLRQGYANEGGAILNQGQLSVANSAFINNSNYVARPRVETDGGGAILNQGTLSVVRSSFTGNFASEGGAIANTESNVLDVANSSFSQNEASSAGGGVFNQGSLSLVNSTFYRNSAEDFGGGISNDAGTISITQCTITKNESESGGGIDGFSGTLIFVNSIVADNSASVANANIYSQSQNNSYTGINLFGSPNLGDSDDLIQTGSGIFSTGTLTNNGGPVPTVLIQEDGPAHNSGDNSVLPTDSLDLDNDLDLSEEISLDARDLPRISQGTVDIGAVELALNNLVVSTLSDITDGDISSPSSLISNPGADGQISLREAILAANATVESDSIIFEPTLAGTLLLTQGELPISENLTLVGPGNQQVSISGDADQSASATSSDSRIFSITSGEVLISNLILTRGYSPTDGGAIAISEPSTVSLEDLTISNSFAIGSGGGVSNTGRSTTVTNSILINNSADLNGGAINNTGRGQTTLQTSSLIANTAQNGGAIHNGNSVLQQNSYMNVFDSILSDNSADINGGAIHNRGGLSYYSQAKLEVRGSALYGNTAGSNGGAIYGFDFADNRVVRSTLAGNSAAEGGAFSNGGGQGFESYINSNFINSTVTGNIASVRAGGVSAPIGNSQGTDSIFAGNSSPSTPDVAFLTFYGGNIVGTASSISGGGTPVVESDLANIFDTVSLNPDTNVLSGTLADNGGLVPTVLILRGGVANSVRK